MVAIVIRVNIGRHTSVVVITYLLHVCLCLSVCVSVSISSTDVDTAAADITDLSPSHLTVSSSSVAVVKPCVSTSVINVSLLFSADSHDDSVDRAWREHVNQVLSTSVAVETRAVRTFHLFPRLFYVSIIIS